MKKRITFFAFAAALAFCYSCSNDETVAVNDNAASNEISFRPLMTGVTRATSLNLASLQTNGFYVTATYTSGHTAYFLTNVTKKKHQMSGSLGQEVLIPIFIGQQVMMF